MLRAVNSPELGRRGFFALSVVFLVLVVFRAGLYDLHWNCCDAAGYIHLSTLKLSSKAFWFDIRLPLFPLIIKALRQSVYEVALLQQGLFAGAVAYFLWRGVMSGPTVTPVKLALVVIGYCAALNPYTIFVHHMVLTETVFYAETLFLLGAMIGPWSLSALWVSYASALALCLTREEGLAIVVFCLPALIAFSSTDALGKTIVRVAPLVVMIGLAGAYNFARFQTFTHPTLADARIANIALMRVAYDPDMTRFFIDSGMPEDEEWTSRKGYSAFNAPPGHRIFMGCSLEATTSCAWILDKGYRTYIEFLALHPLRIFDVFIPRKPKLQSLDPYQSDMTLAYAMSDRFITADIHYNLYFERMPLLSPLIDAVGGFPEILTLAAMASSLALLAIPGSRRDNSVLPLTSAGLIAAGVLAYHADAEEASRHLTTYALAFRLISLVIFERWIRVAARLLGASPTLVA